MNYRKRNELEKERKREREWVVGRVLAKLLDTFTLSLSLSNARICRHEHEQLPLTLYPLLPTTTTSTKTTTTYCLHSLNTRLLTLCFDTIRVTVCATERERVKASVWPTRIPHTTYISRMKHFTLFSCNYSKKIQHTLSLEDSFSLYQLPLSVPSLSVSLSLFTPSLSLFYSLTISLSHTRSFFLYSLSISLSHSHYFSQYSLSISLSHTHSFSLYSLYSLSLFILPLPPSLPYTLTHVKRMLHNPSVWCFAPAPCRSLSRPSIFSTPKISGPFLQWLGLRLTFVRSSFYSVRDWLTASASSTSSSSVVPWLFRPNRRTRGKISPHPVLHLPVRSEKFVIALERTVTASHAMKQFETSVMLTVRVFHLFNLSVLL